VREKLSAWLTSLTGKSFNFEAWYSLEDCVTRLERKSERKKGVFALQSTLLIKVSRVDPDKYTFSVERTAGRGLAIKATGRLQRRDDHSTLVTAQVSIHNPAFVVFVLWTTFIGLTAVAHLYVFTLFGMLVALPIWITWFQARNQLQIIVEDILSN